MKKFWITICLILITSNALAWKGKVVKIADGDTITVLTEDKEQVRVRLYGVDSPESKQEFGTKAKDFTAKFCFGKTVDINTIDKDRYGRHVGKVIVDGTELNTNLVQNGFAWVYSQYCKDFLYCAKLQALELQARSSGTGLWADKNPTPPWNFRKKK